MLGYIQLVDANPKLTQTTRKTNVFESVTGTTLGFARIFDAILKLVQS